MDDRKSRLLNGCYYLTIGIGLVVTCTSLFIYLGLLFKHPNFLGLSADLGMRINTANCFFLSGVALLLLNKQQHTLISRILLDLISIGILLLSSITLYEYMSGLNLGIDQSIATYFPRYAKAAVSERMSLMSAIGFILFSFVFLTSSRKSIPAQIPQMGAFLVALIALFSLFNYFYNYSNAYYVRYTSLEAVLLFIITSIGIVSASPEKMLDILMKDNYTGYVLRRAIPFTLMLATVLSFLPLLLKKTLLFHSKALLAFSQASIIAVISIMALFISIILSRKDKQLEKYLMQTLLNERMLQQFASNIELVFYTTSSDLNQIAYVSPSYESIWGKSKEDLYKNSKDWLSSILPEDQHKVYQAFFIDFKPEDYTTSADYRIKKPDGTIRSLLTRLYRTKGADQVSRIIGITIDTTAIEIGKLYQKIDADVSRLIEAENNIMAFAPKFLKMVCPSLNCHLGVFWLLDETQKKLKCIEVWHTDDPRLPPFAHLTRQSTFTLNEGLPGRVWQEKKIIWMENDVSHADFPQLAEAGIAGLNFVLALPIMYQHRFFGVITFFLREVIYPEANLLLMMETIGKNIGIFLEHIYTVKQIHELSQHDALTNLLNRTGLEKKLDQLIAHEQPTSLAVILLKMDQFALINQTYGHDVGDTLLNAVAIRLKSIDFVKTIDIARLEAGKFILSIALRGLTREDALHNARLIHRMFHDPLTLDDIQINISVTIGISLYPEDGLDSRTLIMNADLAATEAEKQGGVKISFFTKELPYVASQALFMDSDLRQVIKNEQLILVYQPLLEIPSSKICSAEVLVRWNHPKHGLLYPNRFIPHAEKTGFIVPLNEHIMRLAFEQLHSRQLIIPISMNISAQQFDDGFHLVEYLESLLKTYDVNPKQIGLEISESTLTKDTEHNISVLTAIHEMGFEIAIDDFGAGFSSFVYLKRLPVHKIKIDKSLINGLPADSANEKIVKAIISMAHALGKIVVAEGVNTKAEVDFLNQEKCDMAQGFYYYKPLSFAELVDACGKDK